MVTRISGLASGMDVDTLVKQMMTAKRVPLDKLAQQKQTLTWQRDNYRDINSKLVDFRNSKLMTYNKSTELNTQTAVVSGNTTALKAEATADANGIPISMEITQLAKPASWESGIVPAPSTGTAKTTSQSRLSALTGADATTQTYNIVINGKTLDFDKDLTIGEVVSKINTSAANVTATFDEVSGKFSIASKTYGSEGKVAISDPSTLLTVLGSTGPYTQVDPQSALVKINGSASTTSFDSNRFSLNGVQFTLLTVSGGNATTVTTQSDPAKAIDTITSFVKDYNDLLGALQTKVDEARYKDFPPLTDEQKKDMSDSDITQWEAKAKSGLLKNDDILKSTISSMREELTKKIGDLSAIGITAGPYYENGKLHIDQTVLKKAILDDPQKVISIFQSSTGGSDGLFDKLTTKVDAALDKIVTKAGTSKFSSDITIAYKKDSLIGKSLSDYTNRISAFQDKLTDLETSYYRKFTSMETAMNKYNNQSSMITNFMAQ
ncbi:flagellar filament capping protein FliD [Paenibacillus sp. 19GGS1-52]|uniref:flagellar filament capping protein FliD n=1 Tax=Paenibacillus sp. 19GGS1-52 TaxID=2758563 RepID=UPI001EFA8EE1|nr:flagellar filament capping protein FliD [Paenibacillus sp. 19GGS1-52]ULO07954.1 flagellar filament capping protein FliD [Paenibacillus sp. 19GGS1-52]